MSGTIILTGANGYFAIPAIHLFLQNYPNYKYILTVRDASPDDPTQPTSTPQSPHSPPPKHPSANSTFQTSTASMTSLL
ncbi:hypothetical protein K469DRAFT_714048 [Zopfia rhizophila CBS 207.26]|uniref:Thioester reductase (TE) domain-containing protein n=1 Tax=Zopfia rhizophila CBS 207.26 TaxID=1314779 RepID=A0A6A6DSB8_9PEZI|nr:hypothetical protein K469DRAFT_714048 [Zopfia rhizophila CBS 207.26]